MPAQSVIARVTAFDTSANIRSKGRGRFTVETVGGLTYNFALVRTDAGGWKALYWSVLDSGDSSFLGEPASRDCPPPSDVVRSPDFIAKCAEAASSFVPSGGGV